MFKDMVISKDLTKEYQTVKPGREPRPDPGLSVKVLQHSVWPNIRKVDKAESGMELQLPSQVCSYYKPWFRTDISFRWKKPWMIMKPFIRIATLLDGLLGPIISRQLRLAHGIRNGIMKSRLACIKPPFYCFSTNVIPGRWRKFAIDSFWVRVLSCSENNAADMNWFDQVIRTWTPPSIR